MEVISKAPAVQLAQLLEVVGQVAEIPQAIPAGAEVRPERIYQVEVSGATSIADGIGWPQLTAEVAAQDAALTRAGQPPTSIFTSASAEAGALDLYGGPYHLPPVISGHNTFWLWGPGGASDTTVLYVDAAGQVQPYFASCGTVWACPTGPCPPAVTLSPWSHPVWLHGEERS